MTEHILFCMDGEATPVTGSLDSAGSREIFLSGSPGLDGRTGDLQHPDKPIAESGRATLWILIETSVCGPAVLPGRYVYEVQRLR